MYRGQLPEELHEVKLPLVTPRRCRNLMGRVRNGPAPNGPFFRRRTMICAGNVTTGGIDTCDVGILLFHAFEYINNSRSNEFVQGKMMISFLSANRRKTDIGIF